jgi:putative transposase
VIVAEDEAAMYLQATTTAVWAPKGQTPRDKVCFYGSLNLLTGGQIATQAETMNSENTAQHLQAVLDAIPGKPILLLWDRAPWHGGESVKQLLVDNPRLEIMRLPVAAPDLNPQEQVWKMTRTAVSHNHNLRQLPPLADRFLKHLTSTNFYSPFLDKHGYPRLCARFK